MANYESIIKTFTKTVDKLINRRDTLVRDIKNREYQIATLNNENVAAEHEANKCEATARKITEMLQ